MIKGSDKKYDLALWEVGEHKQQPVKSSELKKEVVTARKIVTPPKDICVIDGPFFRRMQKGDRKEFQKWIDSLYKK